VALQRKGPHGWRDLHGHYTNSRGRVRFEPATSRLSVYRLHYKGNTAYRPSHSSPKTVIVTPRLGAHVPELAKTLTDNHVTGQVRPGFKGHLELYRLVSGTWRHVDSAGVDKRGRYDLVFRPTSTGTAKLKVVRPASNGLSRTHSPTQALEVVARDLRSGDAGRDVLALQKRLRSLHYDIGKVDGHFGYDTFHAVSAFQKVQRLHIDGVVAGATYDALARPHMVRLEHPVSGGSVEVKIKKQVVVYAVDGKVRKILDSSTGGGYYYTDSSGNQAKAETPRGAFEFEYKINEWHESDLGSLYRPAYFTNTGYAIHGATSVPSYPASHGCVRITVPAMDRMYDKFLVGMPVWVYG
jgi:peptidoglycan hydrolase-like protein with peptidoglycan-binding domain